MPYRFVFVLRLAPLAVDLALLAVDLAPLAVDLAPLAVDLAPLAVLDLLAQLAVLALALLAQLKL